MFVAGELSRSLRTFSLERKSETGISRRILLSCRLDRTYQSEYTHKYIYTVVYLDVDILEECANVPCNLTDHPLSQHPIAGKHLITRQIRGH